MERAIKRHQDFGDALFAKAFTPLPSHLHRSSLRPSLFSTRHGRLHPASLAVSDTCALCTEPPPFPYAALTSHKEPRRPHLVPVRLVRPRPPGAMHCLRHADMVEPGD
jgi:hypothetical protein